MTGKRGVHVAPPARPDRFELRFATSEAGKGWEDLCRQAPANTRTAYEALESDRCPVPATVRHHALKGGLATGTHRGKVLPQWQYKVTARGRIWYLVDHEARVCWLVHAATAHPKLTE